MKRFTFHHDADCDIDDILSYLDSLPSEPALNIGKDLQSTLLLIAEFPLIGARAEQYCEASGFEVRWIVSGNFRIVYRADLPVPAILAVLHGKQDVNSIMQQRLR